MIFGSNVALIILGIILCILRAFNFIGISWILATCPFWAGFVIDFLLIVAFLITKLINHEFQD